MTGICEMPDVGAGNKGRGEERKQGREKGRGESRLPRISVGFAVGGLGIEGAFD